MMLKTKDLTMQFGGLFAVKDVNIAVGNNELVGLIGPNGAGKTTLFNMVSGYYAPSKGKITFDNNDITGWKPHRITRLGLSRTFQLTRPFGHLSLLDNVIVGALCQEKNLKNAKELAYSTLCKVGMGDRCQTVASGLPVGLRKKLELARILATKPKMILLDEVMGGLSPPEVLEMSDTLSQIHQEGIGVVMIEHVMSAVMKLCQRIFVIHHGEMIAAGTPKEIRRNKAVIEAYLGEAHSDADDEEAA